MHRELDDCDLVENGTVAEGCGSPEGLGLGDLGAVLHHAVQQQGGHCQVQ